MSGRAPAGSLGTSYLGLTERRASKARLQAAAQSLERFVREEHWNGLAAGDVVQVAGHPSRGRHWRFRAHVTNTSNGASWVEVALVDGPPPRQRREVDHNTDAMGGVTEPVGRVEKIRSVDSALVTPRRSARRRRRM